MLNREFGADLSVDEAESYYGNPEKVKRDLGDLGDEGPSCSNCFNTLSRADLRELKDTGRCPYCGENIVATDGGIDTSSDGTEQSGRSAQAPDPDDYHISTIEELDAMRVAAGFSMKDLSDCAGFKSNRFSHILNNDVNPQTRTIRAFLTALQVFDGHSPSGDQGPDPEPSELVDEDSDGPTEVDVERIAARLRRLDPDAVGEDPTPPEADETLRTDGGTVEDDTEQRERFVYRKGGKKLSAFPYPGGKTSYVDEIVRQFPEHRRFVEPFGGSAAVLLNKPSSYIEVFNDLNSDIVHFFEVVRERKEELQEWLRRTPFSRELHEKWGRAFYQGERPDDDLEHAGRWYYLRYTQYGGKVDRFSGFKTSIKRNEARSLWGATEHLDEVVARLQDVILENQDYRKVVDRYDRPDTLFYFDPPYFETTYNYYGTGEFDHQQLAEVLTEIEGYWICSYGDLPPSLKARLIWNRREGGEWTVQQFTAHYSLDTVEGEERDEADEHLVMNFDPRDKPEFTAASQTTFGDVFIATTDGGRTPASHGTGNDRSEGGETQ
jgi:DNA adenine methylase